MDQNPYEPPIEPGYRPPRRRPRAGMWRSTAVGAVLGALTFLWVFHQPVGMGGGSMDDGLLIACALAGGCIGYSVRTMRFRLRTLGAIVTLAAVVAAAFGLNTLLGIFTYIACLSLFMVTWRIGLASRKADADLTPCEPAWKPARILIANLGVGLLGSSLLLRRLHNDANLHRPTPARARRAFGRGIGPLQPRANAFDSHRHGNGPGLLLAHMAAQPKMNVLCDTASARC